MTWLAELDFAWMAWTWQTAVFFGALATLLVIMTVLAIIRPELPRVGVLRIATTRGDRLFIALLGSAFICIFWLAFANVIGVKDASLWWALGLSFVYAVAVFRSV